MDTHLKVRGKGKHGRKQYKRAYYNNKPYWTKELSEQWRKMKSEEYLFTLKNGTKQENLQLRSGLQSQQWMFDNLLKQCKDKFAREQQVVIESIIDNSNQFWSSVKQLLPNKKTNFPLKVCTSEGLMI